MRRACVLLVALAACKGREPAPAPLPPAPLRAAVHRDPHSQARPDEVVVKHLALDLRVDFAAKQLAGTAKLDVARVAPGARELVLDTEGLAIDGVRDCATGAALAHALGPVDKIRGRALTITLAGDCVEIAYRTGPDAHALLWLDPASTTDKRHPMLFTQSESIYARTWIPLQDSPGVRFTYDATIHVPPGQWALMSATNPQAVTRDGVYQFEMELPIPSYLMALAVGDFAFKPIGARTGVYAEPSVVDAAAYEFAEVDAMIAAAEKLYGPYRWGRYDMLVLPASFPFGGMENPRLTFLTPTVINGDRALVSLIAHELAHSWSGNLVTNATWNDLWLNEGITTYVERRIMEELRGKAAVELDWAVASRDLARDLDNAGRTNPDTRLALDLGPDRDPESVPGMIAYEKGAELMRAMELAFGRDAFDAFLRARFDRLAFHSSDSKAFAADAEPLFTKQRVGWTLAEWLDQPGLPASAPAIDSSRYRALAGAATALASTGALPDAAAWTTTDWTTFLDALPEGVAPASLQALDARYHLTASTNVPQLTSWLPRAIHADLRASAPAVRAFLLRVGRRWMTLAVFRAAVAENDFWRTLAGRTFDEAKAGYHPITRASVAELLAAPAKP